MSFIDTNDIKILVNSSFQLLMNSCLQYLKDNVIISVLLLALLSFYIFIPSLFSLLFYTSPLVICTAILLGRPFQFMHQSIRTNKSDGHDENGKATNETQIALPESASHSRKIRPAAMSRRTFKKQTSEELGTILMADLQVDFITRDPANSSAGCIRQLEAEELSDAVMIDAQNQKDDKSEPKLAQEKEKNKPAVELKEEDQKEHFVLGSSETEWSTRIENLIAKRRARKMFNMLPQKYPVDSAAHDFQGQIVSPIKTERNNKNTDASGQPGSAPTVLLPANPFDLPYDPSEEKPVLHGDGFGKEFFVTQPKNIQYCRHESFTYGPSFFSQHYEDPLCESGHLLFANPTIDLALHRYRRQSDAGIYRKHETEQSLRKREILSQINENGPYEVQLENMEANISAKKLPASHLENVSSDEENVDIILSGSRDTNEEHEERQNNTLVTESTVSVGDETERDPDLIIDSNDEISSSSSFEANDDIASASADVAVAVKNETSINSVKKVLGVIHKNRAPLPPPSATESCEDSTPRYDHRTKMEEGSFYTGLTHHLSYSIASDMEVEVSDGPNSSADVESLVFDREELDRDEDDSDEDLQGAPRKTRSKQAEQEKHKVKAMTQDTDLGSIQSPDESLASSEQRLQESNNNNSSSMIGSASTSTEQNIGTYINSPSSNDLQNQDPHHRNWQASVSPPTSFCRSVLHDTIIMHDVEDTITIDGVEDSISTQTSPRS